MHSLRVQKSGFRVQGVTFILGGRPGPRLGRCLGVTWELVGALELVGSPSRLPASPGEPTWGLPSPSSGSGGCNLKPCQDHAWCGTEHVSCLVRVLVRVVPGASAAQDVAAICRRLLRCLRGQEASSFGCSKLLAKHYLVWLTLRGSCRGGGSSIPCGSPWRLRGCGGSKGIGQLPERLHIFPRHPLDHLQVHGWTGLA